MTSYFKKMTKDEVEAVSRNIEEGAYESKRDGCVVVLVKCQKCGKMFEDEVNAFRENINERRAVLCLACDPEAEAQAFSGITVQIGWWYE